MRIDRWVAMAKVTSMIAPGAWVTVEKEARLPEKGGWLGVSDWNEKL